MDILKPQMFTMTIADVAKRFNVAPETVRRCAVAGEIRGVRVGSPGSRCPRWRFSPEAVDEFAGRLVREATRGTVGQ